MDNKLIEVVKDLENQQPIPSVWRESISMLVDEFVSKNYNPRKPIQGILTLPSEASDQIENCIEDYGEKLIALPVEAWETSVCMWMNGYWELLIDLWSESEGRSDLVLSAKVTENSDKYLIEVGMVYVP